MNVLKKLSELLDVIATWIMGLALVLMCFCLVMLNFGRNLFNVSFESLEEISRFTLVWVTFIGSAIAYKRDEHMAFDFLLVRLPQRVQKVAKIGKEFILLALVMLMFACGIELIYANIGQTSMQAMIPIAYVYAVLSRRRTGDGRSRTLPHRLSLPRTGRGRPGQGPPRLSPPRRKVFTGGIVRFPPFFLPNPSEIPAVFPRIIGISRLGILSYVTIVISTTGSCHQPILSNGRERKYG